MDRNAATVYSHLLKNGNERIGYLLQSDEQESIDQAIKELDLDKKKILRREKYLKGQTNAVVEAYRDKYNLSRRRAIYQIEHGITKKNAKYLLDRKQFDIGAESIRKMLNMKKVDRYTSSENEPEGVDSDE